MSASVAVESAGAGASGLNRVLSSAAQRSATYACDTADACASRSAGTSSAA
jgi:hypothetical protein